MKGLKNSTLALLEINEIPDKEVLKKELINSCDYNESLNIILKIMEKFNLRFLKR